MGLNHTPSIWLWQDLTNRDIVLRIITEGRLYGLLLNPRLSRRRRDGNVDLYFDLSHILWG